VKISSSLVIDLFLCQGTFAKNVSIGVRPLQFSLGAASLCCIFPTIGLNPSVIPPNSDKSFASRLCYKIPPLPFDGISRKSRSSGGFLPWSLCVLCRLTLKRAHTRFYQAFRKILSLYPPKSLKSLSLCSSKNGITRSFKRSALLMGACSYTAWQRPPWIRCL